MSMTSSRPYLVRALYDWIVDNECTPYILVNALAEGVEVPEQYVKNGQIVLNISPVAVAGLEMNNELIAFNGRFAGMPMDVLVPIAAVLGIYARENGQGMIFEADDSDPEPSPTGDGGEDKPARKGRPPLKVVK